MGGPAYEYSYAFAHPQSYLESGWSPTRADDEELLAAMLGALQHSYRRPGGAGRAQVTAQPQRPRSHTPPSIMRVVGRQVLASSSERSDHHERLGGEDLFKSAPPFKDDDGLAERARCARTPFIEQRHSPEILRRLRARAVVSVQGAAAVVAAGVCCGPRRERPRRLAAPTATRREPNHPTRSSP